MSLFKIIKLSKNFFGVNALVNVDLEVKQGEIVGLIGPNGSGKTTLFNCATGVLQANGGQIFFDNNEITNMPSNKIALLGMTRTFQTVRVFPDLTVCENLLVHAQQHQEDNLINRLLCVASVKACEKVALESAKKTISFIEMDRLKDEPANSLSYGQRKLLAFGTCCVADSKLILLDEPAAAINPTMANKMKNYIIELNKKGTTFLIVEHNMDFIMNLANRIIVLDEGQIIAEGFPKDIQKNEQVLEAYFGR